MNKRAQQTTAFTQQHAANRLKYALPNVLIWNLELFEGPPLKWWMHEKTTGNRTWYGVRQNSEKVTRSSK